MALWLRLMVNDRAIGYLEARRRPHRQPPQADDVCLYDWTVAANGITRGNLADDPLPHRYGDGAWALIARILERDGHDPTTLDPGQGQYPGGPADDDTTWPEADARAGQALAAARRYTTHREAAIARALNTPDGPP